MTDICFICGHYGFCQRHHCYGGVANRKISEKYGLVIPLCPSCHRELHDGKYSAIYKDKVHKAVQRRAMEQYGWTIEDFIKIIGKNYLEDEE
jgi:transposase-like protein